MTPPPDATANAAPARTGSTSVLWLSTTAFTLMFAVWLMFGILGKPIQKEFGLTEVQLSWVVAAAALNGSLWRLPTGMITDRIGGRKVLTFLLVATAVPAYLVSRVDSYAMLIVLAFLVGFAGNSFSAGIAWNSAWQPRERQGFALGLFGAGNVGASVTKFIGPPIITGTAGATYFGIVDGGWRLVPVVYSVLLLVMAAAIWFGTPSQDMAPGTGQPLREQVKPLRSIRVWRFSLYYVAVFGAYVALAAWLPTYYIDNFDVTLQTAALLTATYIFPASLLRPYGGHLSDRYGARRVMYWTFGAMLLTTGLLMMPNGHIVIAHADGRETEHLAYSLGLVPFAILVFLLGCAMGVGKAAVFKHIPEYFPKNVGAVGGLVGMLGGLGGFFLPPLFAYTKAWSGFPTSTFFVLFVLTLICAVWMHLTVVRMLHDESPQLAHRMESPAGDHPLDESATRDRTVGAEPTDNLPEEARA
ncbi:NarK/NasA family nitrate transporter [Nocardioides seonyuensis]|uniref:NarK/NasA family nitrate transporter n=1 Tax=Nocardioides seonyuensis TaxID=2518371 RepID=A0A4P7ICF4_9ACTN|nr:nitrate/nitrite transporter [Nocardioides seonyuensis]QBX54778.1 NarK/NasA family nitrate transporter [Nocardioides seonyuensis]